VGGENADVALVCFESGSELNPWKRSPIWITQIHKGSARLHVSVGWHEIRIISTRKELEKTRATAHRTFDKFQLNVFHVVSAGIRDGVDELLETVGGFLDRRNRKIKAQKQEKVEY
jgi:hypothetical protein